jgi:hypothetical protein
MPSLTLFRTLLALLILLPALACRKSTGASGTDPVTPPPPDPWTQKGPMVFQSNFEAGCSIVPHTGVNDRITGRDNSLATLSDWDALETTVLSTRPHLNYNGGDSGKRTARLVPDPVNPSNRVLHYRVRDTWLDGGSYRGRVQYEFYNIRRGFREYHQSVRVFLPAAEFDALRKYPASISWLTIVEIWNNITWSQTVGNRYRLTLGIGKLVPTESDLCFILDAQDCELFADGSQKYTTLWSRQAPTIAVPVGRWFTMEYWLKEGNRDAGRFVMAIQPDGGARQTVFDVTHFTHHSGDAAPDGVTHFNPMKLYTSKPLVDYLRQQGLSLGIYWDDFRLWAR